MPLAVRVNGKEVSENSEVDREYLKLEEWLRNCESSTPETEWRLTAIEDYRFYAGKQDADEVAALLASQNRPNSTFNEVKPKIDMLTGIAAQVKYDGQVIPVGAEDEALAELMDGTQLHYRRKLKLLRKELDCFDHMVKSGRSMMYFWLSKANPFKAEIKCKRLSGFQFRVDPESVEYDLSDARYVFIEKWLTEEELKVFDDSMDVEMLKGNGAVDSERPTYFNEASERYRVLECWYRRWEKRIFFENPMSQQMEELSPEEFRKLKKLFAEGVPGPDGNPVQYSLEIAAEALKENVYYMLFSGEYVIEWGKSPFLFNDFPCILFGAYKDEDENRWFSAIEMMKDPQRSLNTMRRQLIHLLQTLPKGILMHEVGAILDIEEYQERSADPGYHMEIARNMLDKVKFEKQPQISSLYQQLDADMRMSMKASSGIQEDLMGEYTASREPGITVQTRQQAGMAVLFILYDNFKESRLQVNRILLKLIQQFVSEPEMIRIQGQKGMQLMQINNQLNPQMPGFNDIMAGEYDLEMDEVSNSPTGRMAIAQLLTEFSHNNPGAIPPDIILEYANVPFTVKQRIQQFWEMQRKIEQENIEADRAVEIMKIKVQADNKNQQAKAKEKKE